MTKAEFYAIVEDHVGETLLHASYSHTSDRGKYAAIKFAMRAMLAGLRARLELPEPE